METTKNLIDAFIKLSKEEKQEFLNNIKPYWPNFSSEKYQNPKTSILNVKELQEKLVQLCIDFLNEYNLDDIDEVCFSADCLQESRKQGCWTSATDSFIDVYGFQKDEFGLNARRLIGEYY